MKSVYLLSLMDVKPPHPVDLVQQRRLRSGRGESQSEPKTKAKAKAKAVPKAHFRFKFQNRNGVDMPNTFDNEEGKQILQLGV